MSRQSIRADRLMGAADVRHDFPDGYVPLNFCRSCGRDFVSVRHFDRHRVGSHEHSFSREHEDGRRCRDDDELVAAGLRAMTLEEMQTSPRQRRRAGSGVEMWFDPQEAARPRSFIRGAPKRTDALRRAA